jgi:hypothetical protein
MTRSCENSAFRQIRTINRHAQYFSLKSNVRFWPLAFAKNMPTFNSSATKRKEGDPMSNEFSDLVTGFGKVVEIAGQPSL